MYPLAQKSHMSDHSIFVYIQTIAHKLHDRYQDPVLCEQYSWWMVQAITKKNAAQLVAHPSLQLSKEQKQQLNEWIDKQINEYIPLQYLIGSVPFNDVTITVRPPILIPRPETEEWCINLIEKIKKTSLTTFNVLDVCTGTGCVALALAKAFGNANILATDILQNALDLARENAALNKITNISWLQSDLYTNVSEKNNFDLIVSNPPYIDPKEWQTLDPSVTHWEDKNALIAPDHGFDIIKKIIMGAADHLRYNKIIHDNNIGQLWIEIGHQQGDRVHQLMKEHGFTRIRVEKDMEKKDRVVIGSLSYAPS